ncbi:PiggyBac transposable element-derived protein 2 [Elysia marginata]|uniref:PiggyBac transposable element-derived protein 2 n=1 Tax=Elysia marginata TaxID=1093978 RepID=A0AAV4INF2_9GAST|nr:PiggyBac transposable element-derived protein 2 [Elysia marginata]
MADVDFQDDLPLDLFQNFITDEMIAMVVEQTNLYSFHKSGKQVISIDMKELKQVIGIYLMMGVVCLDSQRDYWAEATRIEKIASIMTRDRFHAILANIHFADNLDKNIQGDKIWKISPWLSKLRNQCLLASPPTKYSSIDEMIIPFQGKFSKIKQSVK